MKWIKQFAVVLLSLLLVLSLAGCKSKEARAVDAAIAAIGEVTLDSGQSIKAAEDMAAALEDEDLASLEHLDMLEQARATYDDLKAAADAADIDAAIAALGSPTELTLADAAAVFRVQRSYNDADNAIQAKVTKIGDLQAAKTQVCTLLAADIDQRIAAIGTVTLDKTDEITKLRQEFNNLDRDAKTLTQNGSMLSDAENRLCQLRVAPVEKLISAIGTVTWRSEDAIQAAQEAYNALSADDRSHVSNADQLKAAPAAYREAVKQHARDLLNSMGLIEDKVEGNKFYYPSGFPRTSSYWLTSSRTFVLPYIGVSGSNMWLRLVYNYTGRDWIFFTKVTISVDGSNYYKTFDYFDVTRDNSGRAVWEYEDTQVSSSDLSMLQAMADSDETIIRFSGKDYHRDITLSQSDKNAIRDVLTVYAELG